MTGYSVWRRGVLALAFVAAAALSTPSAHADTSAAFSFDITLSAKAAKKLAALREGITLSLMYYGDAKKNAQKHADETGRIALGDESIDLPGKAGKARFSGAAFQPKRLKWVDGPVLVNVNIFSSRKSCPDNILGCDLVEGELKAVTAKPFTVHCALLTENLPSGVKP